MIYSKAKVEHSPQHVKHNAVKDCIPSKYQSPFLKNPSLPFVVSNGIGLSAHRPTAITPKNIF